MWNLGNKIKVVHRVVEWADHKVEAKEDLKV
jgi:hypothetical protein